MRRVDLKMVGSGYKYFRYMDDIKIVCDSGMEARRALKDLVIELRQLGLSVNSKKCLKEDDLTSREFRFAINRLILLAGFDEISVPETYFSEITELIIAALHKQPTTTDKYVSYLERVTLTKANVDKIVELMINKECNIYEWQTFRLWSLLGTRKVNDLRP